MKGMHTVTEEWVKGERMERVFLRARLESVGSRSHRACTAAARSWGSCDIT